MTTNWKSTIHHAYTTPNLLHPNSQKSIPSLIRDEISKLANLKLFQTNIQANSSNSQVPVDMKFTNDSLDIRLSKTAPWISLVPSAEPMSSQERAVDAVRRDVMEKIASLWGGASDSALDESDLEYRGSSGSSSESNPSTSRRTRSRRSRRAERNRGLSHGRGDSITISGNTIDSSTHTTTNNYYGYSGSYPHSPNNTEAREEATSRRDVNPQTDFASTPLETPLPAYQGGTEELRSSDDSRRSDSSSDESKKKFTSFSDQSSAEKKAPLDASDTESESSYYPQSSDESEYDSRSSFSIKSEISDELEFSEPDSAEVIKPTIRDLENMASDLERVISKEETPTSRDHLDVSDSEDEMSSQSSSNQDILDLMTFPDDEDPEQVVDSTIHYLENIASQFERIISDDEKTLWNREQGTNTEDSVKRDNSSNTVPQNMRSASTETDPDVFPEKIRSDLDQGIQPEQELFKEESIHSFEDVIPAEDISKLNQFISESFLQTEAFIKIAENVEEELDPQLISSMLTNRTILKELQDIINSDPQLIIGSSKIDTLLSQLDLEVLRFIHNDSTLEIPYFNSDDSSSDTSTLVTAETSVESEDLEDNYIDDEIENQPSPTFMQISGSSSFEDLDDELETSLDGAQDWIDNPIYEASTNEKETQSTSTQTDVYTTENEAQLQKELRKLQEAFERTKSSHKNELASLMRAEDRLAFTANEKIKQILQNSIENEKKSFSRYQRLYEKYNNLLEDSSVEIEDLKKNLQDLEVLDLAKKAEFDRLRNQFYSPAPIIISEKAKVETKTQSTQVENQVEDMAKSTTSSAVESKPVKVKTNPPTVSKKKDSLHDRNLKAADLMALRKEKAALELKIQRNQFPKADLDTKKDLLRRIDEELVQRHLSSQKPSTSKVTKEPRTKTPLSPNERDLKDLGKGPFKYLKNKINKISKKK